MSGGGSDAGAGFDHLFTEAVRRHLDDEGYGSWRAISAPDAVSLSFGFPYPDSFPTDGLLAATEAVLEEEAEHALQYGGGEYAERLPEIVAERARNRGIDCTADGVLLTNGATHALDVVAQAFLEPDDEVFVEAPTFMGALKLFRNYGVDIEGIPLDDEGLDVDAVEAALAERRRRGRPTPKFLYTIPNFQNPTGTTLSAGRRRRLLDLAAEYDFVVLEDDAYGDLRYDGEDIQPLAALDDTGRVVRVGTFSKVVAPGVRTGWILAGEGLQPVLRRLAAGGSNTFTRSVLGRYCEDGRLGANVERLRAAYEERRDHMLACLAEHMPARAEWTRPDGGFFVWVELPDGVDADEMLAVAADEGVTYLPGRMFFPDDRGDPCLRLSFSHVSFEEMDAAVEALGRASRLAIADR